MEIDINKLLFDMIDEGLLNDAILDSQIHYAYNEIKKAEGDYAEALYWHCREFDHNIKLIKLYGEGRLGFKNMLNSFYHAKLEYIKRNW